MSNLKESFAMLNKEFETILFHSNESDEVIQYLKSYFRRSFIWRCVQFLFFLGFITTVIYLLVYYVPVLNWNASAIGRLTLIKLILPAYNWQYLYSSRCLIEMSSTDRVMKAEHQENYGEFKDEECTVCENLDAIDRIANTSFGNLNAVYLIRDQPVIITDSHDVNIVPEDFVEFLQQLQQMRLSIPCNTVTNLLQTRTEQPNVKRLLEQTERIGTKEWFLHFRNCEFEAVKASRTIFPHKHHPYFMSTHLPPFHSSWFLISNQYKMLNEKRLPVKDLVFVFQLKGKLTGRLVVQKKCKFFCAHQDFQLNAGESLIFNAEMWDFFYHDTTSSFESLAVTFIQEIRAD